MQIFQEQMKIIAKSEKASFEYAKIFTDSAAFAELE